MSGFIRTGVGTPWTHDLLPVQRDGHDDGWQPPIEPTRSPLGLGPRDVDDWGGAPTWKACDRRAVWTLSRPLITLPCSRRLGHPGACIHPPIRIRTRYGVTRAACQLCPWSTTIDLPIPAQQIALRSALVHIGWAHQ